MHELGRNLKSPYSSKAGALCLLACVSAAQVDPCTHAGGLQTTLQDFFQQGTQPLGQGQPGFVSLLPVAECTTCHANYGTQDPMLVAEPFAPWVASIMAQSARDPLFHALLNISNAAAPDAGHYCIRCHVPAGFLAGHSVPSDGSALTPEDKEGVQCNFCHRMIDPEYKPGISPSQDELILQDLQTAGFLTPEGNNARYTLDPIDVRRGPFDDVPFNLHPGRPQPELVYSPFHTKGEFCWTCHDVSNPLMVKSGSTYEVAPIDSAHPTGMQQDMFPLHRTYSEWKNSYYSTIGVQHDGRFGGNHKTGIMKDCQDCHMPDQIGYGCNFTFDPFFERPNVPQHSFIGSNTWVVRAVRVVDADNDSKPDYPDAITGLSDEKVDAAVARNIDFLEKASDLSLSLIGSNLRTRIFNRTGHKLPTGFPDGRRIWVNVRFFDCLDQIVAERGAYDFDTAILTADDTKVYEAVLGISGADYALSVGEPEGHTFNFVLANALLKDNRIPPSGHSVTVAQQNQTAPVGAFYANGQNWDDTLYEVPSGVARAVVTVYYQLASREWMEFLRDSTTDNLGQIAFDLWQQFGQSTPVVMDMAEIDIPNRTDVNGDNSVNIDDLLMVINAWGTCPSLPDPCPADVNRDGQVNIDDLLMVINGWGGC
jgi:hypothetical protein